MILKGEIPFRLRDQDGVVFLGLWISIFFILNVRRLTEVSKCGKKSSFDTALLRSATQDDKLGIQMGAST